MGNEDLKDEISENALGPKSTSVDGVTTTAHSLTEQIEADRYLRERGAANKRKLPIRIAKIRPGGAA